MRSEIPDQQMIKLGFKQVMEQLNVAIGFSLKQTTFTFSGVTPAMTS